MVYRENFNAMPYSNNNIMPYSKVPQTLPAAEAMPSKAPEMAPAMMPSNKQEMAPATMPSKPNGGMAPAAMPSKNEMAPAMMPSNKQEMAPATMPSKPNGGMAPTMMPSKNEMAPASKGYGGMSPAPYGGGMSPAMSPSMAPGSAFPSSSPSSPSMAPGSAFPTGVPSGPPAGSVSFTSPATAPVSGVPQTVQNPYYTAGYLKNYIGRDVRIEFLVGSSGPLVDRIGTLLEVGASYVVIRPIRSNDRLMCDLYSIKFVTIYGGQNFS